MTTNTEALRRAFEGYINPDADIDMHWQAAGYYAGRNLQMSWLDFQAGHAAAIRAGAPPDTLPEAGALRQSKLRMNDTEADCQAWAYFNKWCRGGGV